MERKRPAMKWVRSAYVVYGIIFFSIIGGIVQVLDVSDHINHGLVKTLETHPDGVTLDGKYLFPKNWLTLVILFVALILIFPLTTLLRYTTEKRTQEKNYSSEGETVGLRQDLDDAIRFANNITSYIYPASEDYSPRFSIREAYLRYDVDYNGDTVSESRFLLECIKDPFHFYVHWIRSDPESGEIKFLRQLNFQAFDLDNDRKLDWLPIQNDATRKSFAIFFPEVQMGQRKSIRIIYRWPCFMGKLIQLGATNFDWQWVTNHVPAYMRTEWNFHSSLAPIECRTIGRSPRTATLRSETRGTVFSWIYEDPQAILNKKCGVEFFRPAN